MINIINGEAESGKTTTLINTYNTYKRGDGYALVSVETKGVYAGQDIVRLSDKHFMPFSRVNNFIPDNWIECERYSRFSFSKEGMDFAKQIIWQIVKERKEIAYIDEIGPLEFAGGGVSKEFSLLVRTVGTIFVTVRNSQLSQFFNKYIVKNRKIIKKD